MKAKIIIPNIIIVLLLGLGLYVYLGIAARMEAESVLNRQLTSVAPMFARSESLRGNEQLKEVTRLSMMRKVTSLFRELPMIQQPDEDAAAFDSRLRAAWFKKSLKAVEAVNAHLESNGRSPSIVFVTDRNGVVLARNTTPNACPAGKNVANAMAVVKRALDGEPGYSVWSVNNSPFSKDEQTNNHVCALMNTGLMEIAVAPVWGQSDQVAGVLAVGYEISNGTATQRATSLGMDLAILQRGVVYSTSLTDNTEIEHLNNALTTTRVQAQLEKAYKGQPVHETFGLTIGDSDYWAYPIAVMNAAAEEKLVFLFLAQEKQVSIWHTVKTPVLLFFIGAIVCVFIAGVMLGNYFMKPVIEIEEGVLRIINGETNYRFDVDSAEVGGLSFRINQLVNALTGEDEPDEEDENGENDSDEDIDNNTDGDDSGDTDESVGDDELDDEADESVAHDLDDGDDERTNS
ncbi:MAG: hypothetical protein JXR76_19620 [Deltaproteobacteria bacterium]|nr:hypothetical protein [Deltaproteobacteria bacterium]